MLTEGHHPSQALADLMTLQEAFPGTPLDELKLAYVGDGNNVARSLALLGTLAGVDVAVASPAGYELEPEAGGTRTHDPRAAVAGAHALYADVWVSMGDEDDGRRAPRRARALPARRRAARRRRAGRDRPALPSRPSGRGDHR